MAHFKNKIENVESHINSINTAEELIEIMKHHSQDAYLIYEKSIDLHLQNSQEFMDWQDSLNGVSQVYKEDL